MNNLNTFDFQDKKFLLLGEIHGVKENIGTLKLLVGSCLNKDDSRLVIAFEWPAELTGEINDYLKGKVKLNWRKWNFVKYRDGRISKEHLKFLNWIKKINLKIPENKKIKIQCFDVSAKKWNTRDEKMARILLRAGKGKKNKVIAIMGNFHAQKEPFFMNTKKHVPLGTHLPKRATSNIKLEYLSGYFFNEKLKRFPPIKNIKKIPISSFQKIKESGYDYVFYIKKANPISLLL